MKVYIRHTRGSNIKKVKLCLWPRRILWVVEWMNTGAAVCAAQSRGAVLTWCPVPRCLTADHGPHPLPCQCASLPMSRLVPGSSVQPPWRFSSGGRQCNIHPGGRVHLSLTAEPLKLAAPCPSPSASGFGFQEPDRPSAATGHTRDSYCCSRWSFASSTKTSGQS